MDAGGSTWWCSTARRCPKAGWGSGQAAQGRDPRLPADPGAHRSSAGRLAGHVVAGRGGGAPPDRPAPARRDRRRAAAPAVARGRAERRIPRMPGWMPARRHGPRCPIDDLDWPEVLSAAHRAPRPDGRTGGLGDGAGSSPARPAPSTSPASPWRCGPRARRPRSSRAWSTRCTSHARPLSVPGRLLDVVGHRGRPVVLGQHLHDGRDRRGGCRGPRWSSTATAPPRRRRAARTCWRCSGSGSTCRPRRWSKSPSRRGDHVLLRSGLPPGPAPRRTRPLRARHRHELQPARPDRQPGPPGRPGDRLRRRRRGPGDRRRVRPARGRRVGLPR